MNFNNTMRQMMWKYPGLFSHRVQALNHLFLTNGNGYEWKNGQLIDCGEGGKDIKAPRSYLSMAKKQVESLNKLSPACLKIMGKPTIKKELKKVKEEYIKDLKDMHCQNTFYPLCKYAKILNIPDDIELDWVEGVIETCQWILNINEADHILSYRKQFGRHAESQSDEKITNKLREVKQDLLNILEKMAEKREKFSIDEKRSK